METDLKAGLEYGVRCIATIGCLATVALRFRLQKSQPYAASLHWTDRVRKQDPRRSTPAIIKHQADESPQPLRSVLFPGSSSSWITGRWLVFFTYIPRVFVFFNPSGLAIKSMVSQGRGAQRGSALQAVQCWPSLAPNSALTSASLNISPCTSRALQTLPPEGLSVNLKNVLIKLTHRPICTHFVFYFPSQIVLAIKQIFQPLWVRPWFGC